MFFLKELPSRSTLERYGHQYPEMNVDSVESALKLMQRASILLRKVDAYFSRHDFSQLRFLVCIVIDRESAVHGLTPGEIVERIDVSKPVMARTLSLLEEAGMVEVRRQDADRRSKLVVLTSKGKRHLDNTLPGYYALMHEYMTEAGDDDG